MKSSTDRRTYTHTVGGFQVCRSARFQFQMRPDRLGCVAFVCLSVCKMGEEGSKISNERGWRLQMFLRLYFHHSDNQTHLLSQIYLNGFDEDPKAFSFFFFFLELFRCCLSSTHDLTRKQLFQKEGCVKKRNVGTDRESAEKCYLKCWILFEWIFPSI